MMLGHALALAAMGCFLGACDSAPAPEDAGPEDAGSSPLDAGGDAGADDDAGTVADAGGGATGRALYIPPLLEGPTLSLTAAPGTWEFFDGVATNTYGYNGGYLGPTLLIETGTAVDISVLNNLAEDTTVHWHGLHVAPTDDGGPHTTFAPGETWNPTFTMLNHAATFWYHPHPHGQTTAQVNMGLAGMMIVRDATEMALSLPRTYGVDDIPVVLQDRTFDASGQIMVAPLGETAVINGTIDAVFDAPAQMVRLRLLNGSNERTYMLGFDDGRSFEMIATEAGLREAPLSLTRLQIAPGERAEIVVDLSGDEGGTVALTNYPSELGTGILGGPSRPGTPANALNDSDTVLLTFSVGAATADAVTALPATLTTHTLLNEVDVDVTRPMVFADSGPMTPFTINGAQMDMAVINERVALGATEVWEITNTTPVAHPFHIHDISFYVLDREGVAPPAEEIGWKDVVLALPGETVRVIMRFDDFSDPVVPYMYHCHILPHEDGGMMGQFLVE